MAEEIVILCTSPSQDEAERLARHLLELRVAACVTVVPASQSYYWWQGAIESSTEYLLLIKSSRSLFPAVEEAVRQIHSYQVPEVVALPIIAGSGSYLNWLNDNLRPPE
jgi:periplasmic divalent cation tolerance protein